MIPLGCIDRREGSGINNKNSRDERDGDSVDAVKVAASPSDEDNPALHYHRYLQLERVLGSPQLESVPPGSIWYL